MKSFSTYKVLWSVKLLLVLIFISNTTYAQDRSDKLELRVEYLEDHHKLLNMTARETLASKLNGRLHFFNDTFNLLSYTDKNETFNVGLHAVMEEDLPENKPVILDFFTYNLGILYKLKRFRISLMAENFFGLFDTDLAIEPAIFDSNNQVYLEHDLSSSINLSFVYTF